MGLGSLGAVAGESWVAGLGLLGLGLQTMAGLL